jgi:hypothetical protein
VFLAISTASCTTFSHMDNLLVDSEGRAQ